MRAVLSCLLAFTLVVLIVLVEETSFSEAVCSSALSYGDNVQCSIDTSGEVDTFTFPGADGEKIFARMGETSSSTLVPKIEVYRPDDTLLCSNTAANNSPTATALATCTLNASGTFTVKAKDKATGTGSYGLYIQRVNNPVGATTIAYGDNLTVTLASAEVTEYAFSASSGDKAFVRMATTDNPGYIPNPQLRVYRPDGSLLCEGDSGYEKILTCTADATGTHLILATTKYNTSGGFGVYLQRLNGPTGAASISYGDNATGTLAAAEVYDYAFSGSSGELVYARLSGTGGQNQKMFLGIYKPDGSVMCSETGPDSPPILDFDCTLTA